MDIFEKQEKIEAIKTIIKARWFIGAAVFLQGLIIKYFFESAVPLAGTPVLTFIILGYFVGNLLFWLYLRQPAEKLGERAIKNLRILQVPLDQMAITAVIYFSGTVNGLIILLYPMTLIIASNLYRRRGVFFAAASAVAIFSGLAVLEYLGIMRPSGVSEPTLTRLVAGDKTWLAVQLLTFTTYLLGSAFVASLVADLFKRREKRLKVQKDEVVGKTKLLTAQAEELTRTKNWLHEALTKSDKNRVEMTKTKEELEETNRELQTKITELEKFNKAAIGREMKMTELKKEIQDLKDKLNSLESQ